MNAFFFDIVANVGKRTISVSAVFNHEPGATTSRIARECTAETRSVSEGTFAEGEPEVIRRPKVAPKGPLWAVRASGCGAFAAAACQKPDGFGSRHRRPRQPRPSRGRVVAPVTKTRVPRDTKTAQAFRRFHENAVAALSNEPMAFRGFDDVNSLPPLPQPAIACAGHAGFVSRSLSPLMAFGSYARPKPFGAPPLNANGSFESSRRLPSNSLVFS